MGAGSGWRRERGVLRVRGRLGQDLTAQAGSKGSVGAPSPPPKEWFLTSSCHWPQCLSPIASCEPSPGGGVRTGYTGTGTRLGG